MSDYQKLRDLASKATPGPWFFTYATVRKSLGNDEEYSVADMPRVAGDTETRQGGHDGEYIAAVNPSVILELLDEVERLSGMHGPVDALERVIELEDLVDRQARHITILVMDQRRQLPADVLKDIADAHHDRDSARQQLAAAQGEVEKHKQATRNAWAAQHDALTKLHDAKLRLEDVTAARDEACEIAAGAIGDDTSLECVRESLERLAELQRIGAK